jgi:hypothetical protein
MPKPPASRSLTYVEVLARGHTKACVEVLCGIVGNNDAPMSVRIKAAKILLNRGWAADVMTRPTLDEMLRGLMKPNDYKLPPSQTRAWPATR